MTENNFNRVMDLMDEYDTKLAQVIDCYDDAMISLSSLKFSNPYCPISTRGFKVTPAFKGINSNLEVVNRNDIKFN